MHGRNRRLLVLFFICLFLSIFFPSKVFAVSVSIMDFPVNITDSPFNITASISGASTGTNYLKIDIFKEGSTNYFGETFNGSDWYAGSNYLQYFPINVQSGVLWNGVLQSRAGSPSETQYDATGTYKIRVRRYTSGGGYTASEANNSSVTISLNLPTPTPSITPAAINQNTPVPTLIQTNSPTPSPRPSMPVPSVFSGDISSDEGVLGESTETATLNPSSSSLNAQDFKSKEIVLASAASNVGKILMFLGFVFILACGILFFWPFIKKKIKRNEK